MKSIALVPLAALAIIGTSLSQDWIKPRVEARLGWDHHAGFAFDLRASLDLSFGPPFSILIR